MTIQGCSSCAGDIVLEITQFMRNAQMEQASVAEASSMQNAVLQIDDASAEGIAENIDITV